MPYVLVVEDERPIQRLTSRWLRAAGHTVKCASTAAEALQLLAAETPSVLLCDYGLPDQNGWLLAEQARERVPALVVVMMTGGPQPLSCGEAHFLQKPFSRGDLIAAVSRARAPRESFA